ncbi:MAG: flippase-like domain-containing protein [Bryobacteraceae bacterium]|nr:flippase-like domain-containing protein [Bryobacteraceae bacterium]
MSLSTRARTRPALILILTNVISIACLVWVLHDANLAELKNDILSLHWGWLFLASLADVSVYFWQAWRWRTVLLPVQTVSYWHAVRAIYVGLFGNEVLPLRAGEAIRPYLLARWGRFPLPLSISSVVIERIFDGIWIVVCMVVVLELIPFSPKMQWILDGAYLLGGLVLIGTAILGVLLFRRESGRWRSTDSKWKRHFWLVADELARIGHSRYLYLALALSLVYLLLQVIPIYAVMQGYGLSLGWKAAFVTMVLLRLGSVPPQAPGNIGLFQLIAKETLENLFGVPSPEAARFSLVLWGVVTLPLLLGGFVAMVVTGVRLGQLQREAAAHMESGLSPDLSPNPPLKR